MQNKNKEFLNINYKKITWENFDKITPDFINNITKIDNLFYRIPDDLVTYINYRKKNMDKTIFYLMYNQKELLGVTIGHIKNTSDLYYYSKKNQKFFQLTEMYISPKHQNKGLGTLLMSRVIADQRVKHKTKFISMTARPFTQKINKNVTGTKPFIIPFSNSKEIIRNFKNSKFKYNLVNMPVGKDNLGPAYKQKIYINKNKKNKINKPKIK